MTSIRGYTDLLAQGTVGPINEIQSNFLNTIRSNVNRMANLVSDLADVSRIEAGRMRLEFGSVAIAHIIDEVLNSVNAQLSEKDHTLDLAIPDDLPNVWGDYNRLIQVMNNLLSNAIKYTPQNGRIQVACQITDNTRGGEDTTQLVLISVSDSGYGIAAEDCSKIFHKFFRSSDQNIRDVPGTGLGLNITRHLVEMQGGQIWFDSVYGEGTTFNFTVPVAATD
ncbi:MAG: sensor histidine kinase, partial [Anaerolineales bacterium]